LDIFIFLRLWIS